MTTLMSLLISCQTTAIENKVPNPIVNGESVVKLNDTGDYVIMPYWYWKDLMEYIIIEEESK